MCTYLSVLVVIIDTQIVKNEDSVGYRVRAHKSMDPSDSVLQQIWYQPGGLLLCIMIAMKDL